MTKGYGKQMGKAGPVLDVEAWRESLEEGGESGGGGSGEDGGEEKLPRFRTVEKEERVRLLAPRELLRLHGFPETFEFPPGVTNRQAFALIGNSVSVQVVTGLLEELLGEGAGSDARS